MDLKTKKLEIRKTLLDRIEKSVKDNPSHWKPFQAGNPFPSLALNVKDCDYSIHIHSNGDIVYDGIRFSDRNDTNGNERVLAMLKGWCLWCEAISVNRIEERLKKQFL